VCHRGKTLTLNFVSGFYVLLNGLFYKLHYGEIYMAVGVWVWAEYLKIMMSEQLHRNDAIQCGICVSTHHLLYD